MSVVSIIKGEGVLEYPQIKGMVKKAVDNIGGFSGCIAKSDYVLLKPNFVYPGPPPTTTSPEVIKAVLELVKEEVNPKRIAIGESSSYENEEFGISDRSIFDDLGISKICQEVGAEILPFEEHNVVEVPVPNGILLKKCKVFKPVVECDKVINLPAMKTHLDTLITMAMKNIGHGYLEDSYRKYAHRGDLDQKLVDVCKVKIPSLNILDGLKVLGGAGPGHFGDAELQKRNFIDMNLILASKDIVAIDAVASAVIGIEPLRVITSALGHRQQLGTADLSEITIKGKTIEEVKKVLPLPPRKITGQFDWIDVIDGGACQHCHASAFYLVDWLKHENLVEKIKQQYGSLTFIMGHKPPVEEYGEVKGLPVIWGECAYGTLNLPPDLFERAVFDTLCVPQNDLYGATQAIKNKLKD